MLKDLKFMGRASLVYGLSSLAHKTLTFLLLPVYTRFLPPPEYGVFAVVNTLGMLLKPVLLLGFGHALIWCVVYRGVDERKTVSTALFFVLAHAALLTLLLLCFAPAIAGRALGNPSTLPLLRLLFPTLFLELFEALLLARMRAREQAARYTAFVTTRLVFCLTLHVVFLAGMRMGVRGLLTANLMTAAVSAAAAAVLLAPALRSRFSFPALKGMLIYGVPMVPVAVSGVLLTTADRLFLQRMASPTDVGLYALGYNVGMAINLAVGGIQMAWLTRMFVIARDDPNAHRHIGALFSYYMFCMGLAGLGLSLLGGEVVALAAPAAYRGAAGIIPLVVASYILNGVSQFTAVGMATRNKIYLATPIVVGAAGLNLFLNALLIPRFGIMGAAWATLASYALMTALHMSLNQRLWRIRYETNRLAKVFGVAAVLFAIGMRVDTPSLWLNGAVKLALTACFPVLLWALRFYRPEECAAVSGMIRGLFGLLRSRPRIG